jgi:hypothetical protein
MIQNRMRVVLHIRIFFLTLLLLSVSANVLSQNKLHIFPELLELEVGETARVYLSDESRQAEKQVVWQMVDSTIAHVSKTGDVTALKPGETVVKSLMISAETQQRVVISEARIKVLHDSLSGVKPIPIFEFTMNAGEWKSFADAFPYIPEGHRLTGSTSNVVAFDKDFNLYALQPGVAVFKCLTSNHFPIALCKIVVKQNTLWKPAVQKVSLRNLRTIVVEFNTDLVIDLTVPLRDLLKITSVESTKSALLIGISDAYFENGTRTLVIVFDRDIQQGESFKIVAAKGFMAMGQEVEFEIVIGKSNETTSIQQTSLSVLKVFPNPVVESLSIDCVNRIKTIEVFSGTGTTQKIYEDVNASHFMVNFSGLQTGIYFIRIVDLTGESQLLKVIKR